MLMLQSAQDMTKNNHNTFKVQPKMPNTNIGNWYMVRVQHECDRLKSVTELVTQNQTLSLVVR